MAAPRKAKPKARAFAPSNTKVTESRTAGREEVPIDNGHFISGLRFPAGRVSLQLALVPSMRTRSGSKLSTVITLGSAAPEEQKGHRQTVDCNEPQNSALANRHSFHPFSGVLPRKIQYAKAENPSTTGVTKAAPINANCWLVDDDAVSHSDRLNGTMFGKTIKTIPTIPTTKRNKAKTNGIAGLLFSASAVSVPATTTNKPTRYERAIPCEAH